MDLAVRIALAKWLVEQSGARSCVVENGGLLSGGAINANRLILAELQGGSIAGHQSLVMRTPPKNFPLRSHNPVWEQAIMQVARKQHVLTPEPLFASAGGTPTHRPFLIMRYVLGTTDPIKITTCRELDPVRPRLTSDLGVMLARIHKIVPSQETAQNALKFLGAPPVSPARRRIAELKEYHDLLTQPPPGLRWAIDWLGQHPPSNQRICLCHGDFRIGNILVDQGRITGVLDWEFASWSDPMEDIGWLCARCWRFGADAREVGGIGERSEFRWGYENERGKPIDWSSAAYWKILATVRWAIIAHHQGARGVAGSPNADELALTGRKAAEIEFDALEQIQKSAPLYGQSVTGIDQILAQSRCQLETTNPDFLVSRRFSQFD